MRSPRITQVTRQLEPSKQMLELSRWERLSRIPNCVEKLHLPTVVMKQMWHKGEMGHSLTCVKVQLFLDAWYMSVLGKYINYCGGLIKAKERS